MDTTQVGLFTDFVVKLVQLGAIGFGALIFIMVFVILFRNQPVAPENVELRKRFVTLGFAAFIFAGVIGVLPMFFSTRHQVSVMLSPSFETADLPPPIITVQPSGVLIDEEKGFVVDRDISVMVRVDDALEQIRTTRNALVNVAAASEVLSQAARPMASTPLEGMREVRASRQRSADLNAAIAQRDWAAIETESAALRDLTAPAPLESATLPSQAGNN